MNEEQIFKIERPHPVLLKYYFIKCLLTLPAFLFTFPVLFFRYHTLRYKFDNEGISMRWGILFRREVNLTYTRIQDIHLTSGIIQRWMGLADIQIQTASGNASAEMVIEGLKEFDHIRTFLYGRMRGQRSQQAEITASVVPTDTGSALASDEAIQLLNEILTEMKSTRQALEQTGSKP